MPRKEKEEQKNEKIIRDLLKLPENRKCVNCNALGPQHVCMNFLTFVCTNCSSAHRDFSHRIKSVSMAKFNSDEITALKAGGNERARQIYFKEWDPQQHSYPDGSDIKKLREFVKHVYVDRKYTGGRIPGTPPKLQITQSKGVGSRRFPSMLSASGSPCKFEVVDDRLKDLAHQNARKSDSRDVSSREFTFESLPHSQQTKRISDASPPVRPITEILGDNVPSLQISGNVGTMNGKNASVSVTEQVPPSAGSAVATGGKSHEAVSLIDLSSEVKACDATTMPESQETATPAIEANPQAPDPNSVEALLFGLSMPSITSPNDGIKASTPTNCDGLNGSSSGAMLPATKDGQASCNTSNGDPPSQLLFPTHEAQHASGNPNQQAHPGVALPNGSSIEVHDTHTTDTKSSARKELPMDLFASSYHLATGPVTNWQNVQGMNMHQPLYSNTMQPPAQVYSVPAKPVNPFDFVSEPLPPQASTFPSLANVMGALPHASAPGIPSPPSTAQAAPSTLLATQAQQFAVTLPSWQYPTATGLSEASRQHPPGSVPLSGTQQVGYPISNLGPIQTPLQNNSAYPFPMVPNSIPSKGGNPFG